MVLIYIAILIGFPALAEDAKPPASHVAAPATDNAKCEVKGSSKDVAAAEGKATDDQNAALATAIKTVEAQAAIKASVPTKGSAAKDSGIKVSEDKPTKTFPIFKDIHLVIGPKATGTPPNCAMKIDAPKISVPEGCPITVGGLIYELGHLVGNGYINNYKEKVKGSDKDKTASKDKVAKCNLSGANRKNRHDEFADVFKEFIYQSTELEKQCPDAYAFVRDNVFQADKNRHSTCGAPEKVAAQKDPSPTNPASASPSSSPSPKAGNNNLGPGDQASKIMSLLAQMMKPKSNASDIANPVQLTPLQTGSAPIITTSCQPGSSAPGCVIPAANQSPQLPATAR
jgi:hypothetical protein